MAYNPNRSPVGRVEIVGFGADADPSLPSRGSWQTPISKFSETIVASRTPLIELSSFYQISNLRDIVVTSAGASVTSSGGTYQLVTTATANSRVVLDSAEHGRYVPGYGGEVGIGVRFTTAPTGNQVCRWGIFDENNGFYFGYDSGGLFVARRRNGVELGKTYRNQFNTETLDGNGATANAWNPKRGNIYHIEFSWYGYGQIDYQIIDLNQTGKQGVIPAHQVRVSGQTSIANPNQHIRVELDNDGTADAWNVDIGGRQYSVIGQYRPVFRNTGDFRVSQSVGTTFVPLIACKRRGSQFYGYSCKIEGFEVLVETNDLIIQLRQNATVSGGTFAVATDHSSGESIMDFNTTASAVTGGEPVWVSAAPAGQKNQSTLPTGNQAIELEIPDDQIVVLCARAVSGTSTVDAVLRIKEEW